MASELWGCRVGRALPWWSGVTTAAPVGRCRRTPQRRRQRLLCWCAQHPSMAAPICSCSAIGQHNVHGARCAGRMLGWRSWLERAAELPRLIFRSHFHQQPTETPPPAAHSRLSPSPSRRPLSLSFSPSLPLSLCFSLSLSLPPPPSHVKIHVRGK